MRRLDFGLTLLVVLFVFSGSHLEAQQPTTVVVRNPAAKYDPVLVDSGHQHFEQNCAFCHGRDANGGESGPDLTHSAVVIADTNADKIGEVVRNGRGAMPKFALTTDEVEAVAAFLHVQANKADSDEAQRRKIDLSDMLTGDADAGKQYFYGKGQCASCHSVTGDLAGITRRYDPIPLEQRMLYPWGARDKLTVTLASGETITGILVMRDEFTVALRDVDGWYRSWPVSEIGYRVDSPAQAHLKLIPKYSDADVHNLFTYLNTIR